MPHIVVEGPLTVEDIWLAFEHTEITEAGTVYKADAAFLSSTKDDLLVRSICVERGYAKTFFVRFSQDPGKPITITLEKLTRPEMTDAVKRHIGLYAWKIMQVEPEATIGATNIKEFIGEPKG